ncbi:hypothetical protein ACFRQM_33270 [Streptomyces sp. NPDC056831]|uniref:hypothetical protein n=1 Tax=Streptomyces sp. NPDC056831 TaxID=3345954 RepID=UPI0036C466EA
MPGVSYSRYNHTPSEVTVYVSIVQAVAFRPALQTGTLVRLAAVRTGAWVEPHCQMRFELSLELRFGTPPSSTFAVHFRQ